MPAPTYPMVRAAATDASYSRSRMPGTRSTRGDGASSTIFWWRRWIEHSRSPTAHTVPWRSAITCTSMWRPVARYGSQKTVGSPNAEPASAAAASSSPGRSASDRTTRMPRPPPPADAFTSTGRSASVTASGASSSSTGTPAAAMSRLDSILEPMDSMAATGGPIQVSPAASTAAAKSAFSDRNP